MASDSHVTVEPIEMDFKRSSTRSPSDGQEKMLEKKTPGTALFFTDVPAISALEQAPEIETVPVSSSREIDPSLCGTF